MRHGLLLLAAATACSDPGDLAGGVAIANVDLFQGPQVPLVRNGSAVVRRDLPVIAGRRGKLTLAGVARAGSEPRVITARAILESTETGERVILEKDLDIAPGNFAGEIEIPQGVIAEHMGITIELVESAPFTSRLDIDDFARSPAVPLDARVSRLRIAIVPAGDPAPRLDDLRYESFREGLLAWLPVDQVELIRAPAIQFSRVLRTEDDFHALLGTLAAWRVAEGLDPDVFAYAPVNVPFGAKVGGMAANIGVTPAYWRVAAGSLNTEFELAVTTLVHEVGHLLGRSHVSCGDPGGPDFAYPYEDGSIGVPGIDQRDGEMRLPEVYVDFMSYCMPAFVSDYGFAAAYRGLGAVSARSAPGTGEPSFVADPPFGEWVFSP